MRRTAVLPQGCSGCYKVKVGAAHVALELIAVWQIAKGIACRSKWGTDLENPYSPNIYAGLLLMSTASTWPARSPKWRVKPLAPRRQDRRRYADDDKARMLRVRGAAGAFSDNTNSRPKWSEMGVIPESAIPGASERRL